MPYVSGAFKNTNIILEVSKEFGLGFSAEGSKKVLCDKIHDGIKIQKLLRSILKMM
jgi:hypothetical protein